MWIWRKHSSRGPWLKSTRHHARYENHTFGIFGGRQTQNLIPSTSPSVPNLEFETAEVLCCLCEEECGAGEMTQWGTKLLCKVCKTNSNRRCERIKGLLEQHPQIAKATSQNRQSNIQTSTEQHPQIAKATSKHR